MAPFFAHSFIEREQEFKRGESKESGRHLYWRTFQVNFYKPYKEQTDSILALEGHSEIIVTEEPEA